MKIGEKEEVLVEKVAFLEVKGDSIVLRDIVGREKVVKGRILNIDFLGHKIILVPE